MLNIGFRGHDISAEDLPELAQKFKEYGLKNIQLVLKKSCKNFKAGMFSPAFAKKIGDIFSANGVDISVLGCYINPSNTNAEQLKADMKYFTENLKYARYMNAGVVGLETGFVGEKCLPQNNHTEDAYKYLLYNMKQLRDAAEKLGVTVAVEGVHDFVIHSPQTMRRLLDDLESPNIAVILDVLNLLSAENYTLQDNIIKSAFDLLGNDIAVIHLKDFVIKDGSPVRCPIGKGLMNIPLILSLIVQNKPNIPIILEETNETDLADAVKYITDIYNNI